MVERDTSASDSGMIRIEKAAWAVIVGHARGAYPDECCGAMLGVSGVASAAVPLENSYHGSQTDRYEIRPEDLLAVDRQGGAGGVGVTGIYTPAPGCDADFS